MNNAIYKIKKYHIIRADFLQSMIYFIGKDDNLGSVNKNLNSHIKDNTAVIQS